MMTHTKLALASLVALTLVACAGSNGDDDDDDDDDPCAPSIPAQECEAQASVECRDQSLVELQMAPNEVTPGLIQNETISEGGFHSRVDATAGGFNGDGGYVYGKFTDDGLVKVDLTDDASFDSLEWDVAFRRFIIRLNSGVGGPGCVTAARGPPDLDFTCPELDAGLLEFNAEQYMSAGTCELIPDGSGLGSPGTVLQNFWDYPRGCVEMTGNVYFVSLADGRFVKLRVTHYYSEASQADCNETGATDSVGSGNIQLDWDFVN